MGQRKAERHGDQRSQHIARRKTCCRQLRLIHPKVDRLPAENRKGCEPPTEASDQEMLPVGIASEPAPREKPGREQADQKASQQVDRDSVPRESSWVYGFCDEVAEVPCRTAEEGSQSDIKIRFHTTIPWVKRKPSAAAARHPVNEINVFTKAAMWRDSRASCKVCRAKDETVV